jgi:hypothetical protein
MGRGPNRERRIAVRRAVAWALGAALLVVVTGGSAAQSEARQEVKVADLVGKWKRAGVEIQDTLDIKKDHSCARNFEGNLMRGKWARMRDGRIVIGFPGPAEDRNALTVRGCKDGRMETVSKSGLLERWKK